MEPATTQPAGIHHITAIARDPQRNLDFYTTVLGLRLVKLTVNFDDPGRFGEDVLVINDPDGLPLELVATPDANPALAWEGSPVDHEHAICGLHSATLSEEGYEQTARLLADAMDFAFAGEDGSGQDHSPWRQHVGSGMPSMSSEHVQHHPLESNEGQRRYPSASPTQ